MDINYLSGLMSQVNSGIGIAEPAPQVEGTAENLPGETPSSQSLTDAAKRKRDDAVSGKVSRRKKREKKDKGKGTQSPVDEEVILLDREDSVQSPPKVGDPGVDAALSEDINLLSTDKIGLPLGPLRSVGVNLHDYFRQLPGKHP